MKSSFLQEISALNTRLPVSISQAEEYLSLIHRAKAGETLELPAFHLVLGDDIVSLIHLAKAKSPSRIKKLENGERYEPFIISSKQSLEMLLATVKQKMIHSRPFEYNFAFRDYNDKDYPLHFHAIQLYFDGIKAYAFHIDSIRIKFPETISELIPDFIICSFANDYIQTSTSGCGIFSLHALNKLINHDPTTKITALDNQYASLPADFLSLAQSLRHITPEQLATDIHKSRSETLAEHLAKYSIIVMDKQGELKKQNRYFEEKLLKYLQNGFAMYRELYAEGDDALVAGAIANRKHHIRKDTFNKLEIIDAARAIELIDNDVKEGKGFLFSVGDIIASVLEDEVSELIDEAIFAIDCFMTNLDHSQHKDITVSIRDIIEAFPPHQRINFVSTITEAIELFRIEEVEEDWLYITNAFLADECNALHELIETKIKAVFAREAQTENQEVEQVSSILESENGICHHIRKDTFNNLEIIDAASAIELIDNDVEEGEGFLFSVGDIIASVSEEEVSELIDEAIYAIDLFIMNFVHSQHQDSAVSIRDIIEAFPPHQRINFVSTITEAIELFRIEDMEEDWLYIINAFSADERNALHELIAIKKTKVALAREAQTENQEVEQVSSILESENGIWHHIEHIKNFIGYDPFAQFSFSSVQAKLIQSIYGLTNNLENCLSLELWGLNVSDQISAILEQITFFIEAVQSDIQIFPAFYHHAGDPDDNSGGGSSGYSHDYENAGLFGDVEPLLHFLGNATQPMYQ